MFPDVPTVVKHYLGFHGQSHLNSASFREIKEELNVCIAAICAPAAFETSLERQQEIFDTKGRLSDYEKPWGRTEEKNCNMY